MTLADSIEVLFPGQGKNAVGKILAELSKRYEEAVHCYRIFFLPTPAKPCDPEAPDSAQCQATPPKSHSLEDCARIEAPLLVYTASPFSASNLITTASALSAGLLAWAGQI